MHGTRLPLRTWFLAAHLVSTNTNGISALQLQAKLGIGSYKSAWFLLHRLRKAMVDPNRSPLQGVVEIDESTIPFRTKNEPVVGGQGRSPIGKMTIIGAVELNDGKTPGRIRLAPISDYGRKTVNGAAKPWVSPVDISAGRVDHAFESWRRYAGKAGRR